MAKVARKKKTLIIRQRRQVNPASYGEWRTLEEIACAFEEQTMILSRLMTAQTEIVKLLREIAAEVAPPAVPAGLKIVSKLPNGTTTEGDHMTITITDVQEVPLSLTKFAPDPNSGGKTIEVPVNSATWRSSNTAIVTLDAETGATNTARAVGPDGTATVTAEADGLTATLDVTVVDSEVASLTIVPGTPSIEAPSSPPANA